jgi:hypothetical protein
MDEEGLGGFGELCTSTVAECEQTGHMRSPVQSSPAGDRFQAGRSESGRAKANRNVSKNYRTVNLQFCRSVELKKCSSTVIQFGRRSASAPPPRWPSQTALSRYRSPRYLPVVERPLTRIDSRPREMQSTSRVRPRPVDAAVWPRRTRQRTPHPNACRDSEEVMRLNPQPGLGKVRSHHAPNVATR